MTYCDPYFRGLYIVGVMKMEKSFKVCFELNLIFLTNSFELHNDNAKRGLILLIHWMHLFEITSQLTSPSDVTASVTFSGVPNYTFKILFLALHRV